MIRNILALALAVLAGVTFGPQASAQEPTIPATVTITEPGPLNDWCCPTECDTPSRCWVSAEYLLWWIKDGPQSFPLVTTGDPGVVPAPGALGQPSTSVLFGGSDLDYGTFSGGRVTLGGWFDCEQCCGLEVSGFALAREKVRYAASSNAAGSPPIYLALFQSDPALNHEGSVTIADPALGIAGGVAISSSSHLWGAEVNGLFNLRRSCRLRLDLLAGFRYLDLQERITLDTAVNDFVLDIQNHEHDDFSTRNQFYGGQIGARLGWRTGRISVDVTGKVALGSTHQSVSIQGFNEQSGSGAANGTFPGGIYAQPSNIGRETRDTFTVVPQAQVKLGVDITKNITASVGYDFMYWNRVVRPGEQMDRSVNQTQQLGGTLIGPARPQSPFDRSDFWSQGVSFGLEFRF